MGGQQLGKSHCCPLVTREVGTPPGYASKSCLNTYCVALSIYEDWHGHNYPPITNTYKNLSGILLVIIRIWNKISYVLYVMSSLKVLIKGEFVSLPSRFHCALPWCPSIKEPSCWGKSTSSARRLACRSRTICRPPRSRVPVVSTWSNMEVLSTGCLIWSRTWVGLT